MKDTLHELETQVMLGSHLMASLSIVTGERKKLISLMIDFMIFMTGH